MIIDKILSSDGLAVKYVLETTLESTDEKAYVEAVTISHPSGKFIICMPTQVGCCLGCRFCVSGKRKNVRNLTQKEMIKIGLELTPDMSDVPILYSFMGEGEVLNNLDNTLYAANYLKTNTKHNNKFAFSTTGCDFNKLLKLAELSPKPFKIQLSVHAVNPVIRRMLMPGSGSLMLALRSLEKYKAYVDLNFILLNNINDSISDALLVVAYLSSWHIKINAFNLSPNINYEESSSEKQNEFISVLKDHDLSVELYKTNGSDIFGGCGQMTYALDQILK